MAHGVAGVLIGFYVKRTLNVLRCVNMRLELSKKVWVTETSGWGCLDLVFGDMNARDLSWDVASNTCGRWVRDGADTANLILRNPPGPTFHGTSAIDLCFSKRPVNIRLDGRYCHE